MSARKVADRNSTDDCPRGAASARLLREMSVSQEHLATRTAQNAIQTQVHCPFRMTDKLAYAGARRRFSRS